MKIAIKRKHLFILSFAFSLLLFYAIAIHGGELKRDPGVNPHDHISDEGEILYYKCIICHKTIPDVKRVKIVDQVDFRFEDTLQPCYSCHPQPMHPGGNWGGALSAKWKGAPNHWKDVTPREDIMSWLEGSPDRFDVIIPLNPVTGKMMCATCHNPHERGLLRGRAEIGADFERRWRTRGMMICLYCHPK